MSVFLGVIGGLTIPPGTVKRVSEERDRVRPRLFSDSAPRNVKTFTCGGVCLKRYEQSGYFEFFFHDEGLITMRTLWIV